MPPGESESFQLIRAHLRYFNVDRELRTLLVASAAPGDGKTTVARHLASAAARVGSRVLLLEVDLRRPTIAKQLDVRSGPGLADVLIGAVPLAEAVQTVELESPSVIGGIEEGCWKVDDVVIVGRNRRDVAQRLHETLSGAGAPLLGVVANGFKSGRLGSYGGYGYSYDYAQSNPEPPTGSGGETPPSPKGSPSSEGSSVSPGGAATPAASPNGAASAEQPVSSPQP